MSTTTLNTNSNLTNNINNKSTKILCILDGFGLNVDSHNNCASQARMPNLRRLMTQYHWSALNADGDQVGQESGLVGNSEVGHMNIGGLKLVPQLSYQITKTAENNFSLNSQLAPDQLFDPKEFLKQNFQKPESNKIIHLVGLFSTGCIHSDMRHLVGAIESSGLAGASEIVIHLFSDGRDSDKKSLAQTWQNFTKLYEDRLSQYTNKIKLGSVGGRFFCMDRDKNYDRVAVHIAPWFAKAVLNSNCNSELVSEANLTQPKTLSTFIEDNFDVATLERTNELMTKNTDLLKTILNYGDTTEMTKTLANYTGISFDDIASFLDQYSQLNYQQGIFDEMILPACTYFVMPHDTIWLFNFRSDRMKQLANFVCDLNDYFGFDISIMGMNDYCVDCEIYLNSDLEQVRAKNKLGYYPVFKNKPVQNTLAEVVSNFGQTQLHLAETEKYAHVTYFFNGGQDKKSKGEDWIVIASNKVESHAQMPQMKAKEITDYIISNGLSKYNYIIVNYANPDMVGHTGDINAGIDSMEFLDEQLGRLVEMVESNGHSMVIIADHGNIEFVGEFQKNGKTLTDTEHNPSPVPCIVVDPRFRKNTNSTLDLSSVFTSLKSKQINFDNQVINKAFQFQSRTDYSSNWLNQEEIKSLESVRMPLWYAGVILMGL